MFHLVRRYAIPTAAREEMCRFFILAAGGDQVMGHTTDSLDFATTGEERKREKGSRAKERKQDELMMRDEIDESPGDEVHDIKRDTAAPHIADHTNRLEATAFFIPGQHGDHACCGDRACAHARDVVPL